jgi:pantoate--beta-alanine ligase
VRESDGLALSSRNKYLSPDERASALSLSKCLKMAKSRLAAGETDVDDIRNSMLDLLNSTPGVTVDYAAIADPDTLEEITTPRPEMIALVAAHVGSTRLIDNLPIRLTVSQ